MGFLSIETEAAEIQRAVRKAAWAACEVNPCGGTKQKPCEKHMKAAEKMFSDIVEIWK